ncbi:MAG TPA: hypothetical protein VES20_00420 [Bryobacteraceae bacterium]|nr:hypothetical protein [Bryobacteraceae bacterium]
MSGLALLLSVSLATMPVAAAPAEVQRITWDRLPALIKDRRVEIVQKDGTVHSGKASGVTAAGIDMVQGRPPDAPRTVAVARENIRVLYVFKGSSIGRTAGLIGLGIGAAVLGTIGVLGAALDAQDAALTGFAGAAGCVGAAVAIAIKSGRKRTELIILDR